MLRVLLLIFIVLPPGIFAQSKDRVEVLPQILSENFAERCAELELGKIIFFYEPVYPPEAQKSRSGGTVSVLVEVEENGNTGKILKIEGNRDFLEIAGKAAQRVKFSPTDCDGKAIKVSALIIYNFIPQISVNSYFSPQNISELADVKTDSPYFEAISNLTENYKISFGYQDKKFYENAPLTRGDFAHFLRLTLDLLAKRAAEAKKNTLQIKLFRAHNPQNLTSLNSIKEINRKQPFYRSVGILLQTYDISLVTEDLRFQGNNPVLKNDVIELWTNIFGKESVPVNFEKTEYAGQFFTRGEFALFLHESMQVLSYKVLPESR